MCRLHAIPLITQLNVSHSFVCGETKKKIIICSIKSFGSMEKSWHRVGSIFQSIITEYKINVNLIVWKLSLSMSFVFCFITQIVIIFARDSWVWSYVKLSRDFYGKKTLFCCCSDQQSEIRDKTKKSSNIACQIYKRREKKKIIILK